MNWIAVALTSYVYTSKYYLGIFALCLDLIVFFFSFRILLSSPLPCLPPIINAILDGDFGPRCNWLDDLEFED